jgi:hypothetical protein
MPLCHPFPFIDNLSSFIPALSVRSNLGGEFIIEVIGTPEDKLLCKRKEKVYGKGRGRGEPSLDRWGKQGATDYSIICQKKIRVLSPGMGKR